MNYFKKRLKVYKMLRGFQITVRIGCPFKLAMKISKIICGEYQDEGRYR